MKKSGLLVLIALGLSLKSMALTVDYGQGKSVELEEEMSATFNKTYKVVWKDLLEPKLWLLGSQASLEFEEKNCKQKQKYFSYKMDQGVSPKQIQDEFGQSTSDLELAFSISDFSLRNDFFKYALDKKGISDSQVLKNDLSLDVTDVEIIYAEGSMGALIGSENAESVLKEKIAKSAFALEEYGKIVLKSNNLALNCALLHDQVEAINFIVKMRQNPKITWIKKVSEQKVLGVSMRAKIENAMPEQNLLLEKKEGPVTNMMNYMLSLFKNNEEELLANKELSYRLFTHITNSDSSKFLTLDLDSALKIALNLADSKEIKVESQRTLNIQIIKE